MSEGQRDYIFVFGVLEDLGAMGKLSFGKMLDCLYLSPWCKSRSCSLNHVIALISRRFSRNIFCFTKSGYVLVISFLVCFLDCSFLVGYLGRWGGQESYHFWNFIECLERFQFAERFLSSNWREVEPRGFTSQVVTFWPCLKVGFGLYIE